MSRPGSSNTLRIVGGKWRSRRLRFVDAEAKTFNAKEMGLDGIDFARGPRTSAGEALASNRSSPSIRTPIWLIPHRFPF